MDATARANSPANVDVGFEYVAYDLFSGIQEYLQGSVRKLTETLGRPGISSSLYTIIYELATNGLKALYKKAFYTYVIHEVGLGDIPYEDWLKIFKTEIATNKAENFAHVCRENHLSVRITAKILDEGNTLRFEVINSGVASKIELKRIDELFFKAKSETSFEKIIAEEENNPTKEETSMGIPLVVMTMKGLGIPLQNFKFIIRRDSTVARIDMPVDLFFGGQELIINRNDDSQDIKETLFELYERLNYSIIFFRPDGSIVEVSGPVWDQINLDPDELDKLPGMIKARFFEDIFIGPFGIRNVNKFENYRIGVPIKGDAGENLYNVSGWLNNDGVVKTLWQLVNTEKKGEKLSEGSLFETIHIQKMIAPYISQMILDKARESIRRGLNSMPNESKEVTVFFADLIGFTHRSETLPHNQVIDLLNLVMGVVVRSIEKNSGYIDKFIGDGVMTIFMEPLSAIVAAIEIQNNLFQMNQFREASGADKIEMRIGMNSGMVILGSVGTKKHMDWTALGDVVNTASRLEKLSRANSVLISEETYMKVKDHVEIDEVVTEKIRGKENEHTLYFIKSVSFLVGEKEAKVSLFTEEDLALEL